MPQGAVLLLLLPAVWSALVARGEQADISIDTSSDHINCTVTIEKASDLVFGGGAGLQANPLLELRSGSPHTNSTASLSKQLVPGVTVSRLSMAYRYETGYGEKGNTSCGVQFSIRVGGKMAFSSQVLSAYPYSKSKDPNAYSPLIPVDSNNLGVTIAANDRKVEFEFANDCRNVQLLLPLVTHTFCRRLHHIDRTTNAVVPYAPS